MLFIYIGGHLESLQPVGNEYRLSSGALTVGATGRLVMSRVRYPCSVWYALDTTPVVGDDRPEAQRPPATVAPLIRTHDLSQNADDDVASAY